MMDKGYFEDTLQIIRDCELIIAHSAIQPFETDDDYNKLRPIVRVSYDILNHIWTYDIQSRSSQNFLMDLLKAQDIQRSLYLHLLCDPEFLADRRESEMGLLEGFELKDKLDSRMIKYIRKGSVISLFDKNKLAACSNTIM